MPTHKVVLTPAAVVTFVAAAAALTLTGCSILSGAETSALAAPRPVTSADATPLTSSTASSLASSPVPRSTAPAGGPTKSAISPAAWRTPDKSTTQDPKVVVTAGIRALRNADATLGVDVNSTKLRVSTLRVVSGKPVIEVRPVTGTAAASAVVGAQQSRTGVVAVAVDGRKSVDATTSVPAGVTATKSNDSFRSQQWALNTLNAEQTWKTASGAGTVVAVIDTGADGAHKDLAGRLLAGKDYVDTNRDGRSDPHGHGTHVSGIVAAIAGNSLGVAGLAPTSRVLPVRVLGADGSGWDSDIAAGIIWAADHGADVINLSLGGERDPLTESAVQYARSKNVVVVAAGGNHRGEGSPVTYPAAYPGVVAVAATTANNVSASFSNVGTYIDLAAPGATIASTWPGQGYMYSDGTSMAAPYVAALAALVIDASNGAQRGDTVATTMRSTATDLGRYGWDSDTGYGLINPVRAVCAAAPTCSAAPVPDPASPSPSPTTAQPSPTTTAPISAPPTAPAPPAPTPSPTTSTPSPTEPSPSVPTPTSPTTSPTTSPPPAPTTPPTSSTPPPPSPAPSPSPSTPSPTTPTQKPAPARKGAVKASISTSGAYLWSGTAKTITATLRRADTGTALAWSPAVLETLQSGKVVARSTVFTNGSGRLSVTRRVVYTNSFRIRYAGSATMSPATSNTVIMTAMPKTSIRYSSSSVTVNVYPSASQRVAVQRLTAGKWVTSRSAVVNSRGEVVLTKLPKGTVRVYVAKVANLDDVVSSSWVVR